MIVPSSKNTSTKASTITIGGTGRPAAHSLICDARPEIVSIRLYICAAISSRKILAVERPISDNTPMADCIFNWRAASVNTSAPAAPIAPASVGVKNPP